MTTCSLKRRILALFVTMIYVVGMILPVGAFGASDATLQVKGSPAGASYVLYRVGDVSNNTYSLSGDFADYAVSLDNLDSDGWRSAAITLAGYAQRDGVAVVTSGKTGEDGTFTFTGLSQGLYMVVADQYKSGKYTYTFTPTIVAVFSGENSVEPKYTREGGSGGGGGGDTFISVNATKVWSDNNSANRPSEVTVQLLRNGKVYEEQVLNAENGWTYRWSGLVSANTSWTLVEKSVPSGYTVSVSHEGNNFVVTNTADEVPPPDTPENPEEPNQPDEPNKPDTPTPNTPSNPTTPGGNTPSNNTPSGGTTTNVSKLPQTGALWWPVPALFVVGVLSISIGVIQRRKSGI